VPLSDFFAASSLNRHPTKGLVASLWMEDATFPEISTTFENNKECIIPEETDADNLSEERQNNSPGEDDKPASTLVNPMYDSKVLMMSFGFILFVMISFNTW
jgi:hypothetical protein